MKGWAAELGFALALAGAMLIVLALTSSCAQTEYMLRCGIISVECRVA